MRIVLIGMMGSGKTSVGRELSALLGWPYVDNDDVLRERTGLSVGELFARHGEPEAHAAEARALAESLRRPGPVIVAVPGGAVLDPSSRELLAGERVVWLRARPETLAARVRGSARPLLGDDPDAAIAALEQQRRPHYARLAQLVVDVDDLAPAEIAARIAGQLGVC
ncbi:MAG: AAA family ATPase [Acidobacteria bacterium]|nr:AAA family ATPase [Acidobacteriota bacterium]